METTAAPATLYEDLDLLLRTARDLFRRLEIVIDDADEYERLVDFHESQFMPRYADRVRHHTSDEIFDAYGLEIKLNRALARKVWLPSGGPHHRSDRSPHRDRCQHRTICG